LEKIPDLWLYLLLSIGVPFLILTIFHRIYRLEMKRAPFVGEFLRSPGESTFQQIQSLNEDITTYSTYLFLLPILILVAIFISFREKIPYSTFMAGALIYLLLIAVSGTKLWRRMKLRRVLRLGYDGEVAVAQEITHLMMDGYHVYHDFPADNFNIDHIIVGRSGVFAVETKTRSKPVSKKGGVDAKLMYNGKMIRFPNYTDTESLKQAERQAQWLQNWLSEAVGDPVRVHPILTFPGWFVEKISRGGIPVLNPKMIRGFLGVQRKNVLSESMLELINLQLEQKCRDLQVQSVQWKKWDEEKEKEQDAGDEGTSLSDKALIS
jgi:Nuclease-related domain